MIFCSVVMVSSNAPRRGASSPQPLRAPPRLTIRRGVQDTCVRLSFSYCSIRAHAAELVALAPDVLVGHTTPGTRALRQATSSIPIVMVAVNDPVEPGFISSLAHPGGNITGFTLVDFQMVGKWLEMLKEAAPGVTRAALM